MLNGRNACFALAEHRAALGVDHILGNSVDDGFTLQVDTLDLIARILGGGIECYCEVQTGMQSFSKQRKAAF